MSRCELERKFLGFSNFAGTDMSDRFTVVEVEFLAGVQAMDREGRMVTLLSLMLVKNKTQ
jgi:hypothetical protein